MRQGAPLPCFSAPWWRRCDRDPAFREAFKNKLDHVYPKIREPLKAGDGLHDTELFQWVREVVTGFNLSEGQGDPLLKR
jgi:hypothetical protein